MADAPTTFPDAPLPLERPSEPRLQLPKGAVDSHVHMVGEDFPLWKGRVENPGPGSLQEWLARLRVHLAALGFGRVVIVHSIVYGDANDVTLAAVKGLGRDTARGIGLIRDEAPEHTLDGMAEGGIVGIRLNYVHGGVLTWEGARAFAPALAERGMHIQMLMNAHVHMDALASSVPNVGVPVVFDHIGWPDLVQGVNEKGFQNLCRLLADGHAYVKLSGLYRLCDAPYDAADKAVAALVAANPERCLWGSDWPHIMLGDANMPDAGQLLNRFLDVVSDDETRQRILVDTPTKLYGFE